jgi:monovalent cation:H+ antiporter-2, CPA2 family
VVTPVAIEVIGMLAAIFTTSALLLLLTRRFALPVIPVYLLAGVLVGALALVDEAALLDLVQWGIAFLVFVFGISIEPDDFGGVGRDAGVVAAVQLLVTGVLVGAVGLGIGLGVEDALVLAIAGSLSSSLVSLEHLEREERPRVTHERLAERIHFLEDLLAVLVLLVLSAYVYSPEPAPVQVVGGLGLLLGGSLFRRLLFDRVSALIEDPELLLLAGISLLVGFIAASEALGISIVVGAFAAGLAVSREYPLSIEVIDAIEDLEDFFSPILFVTLGALVSIPSLETLGLALIVVFAVLVVNPLVTAYVAIRRGYDRRAATLTGLSLDQVSEFSLIVAITALGVGALLPALFDAIVLAAIVTMVVSSYTRRYDETIHLALTDRGLFSRSQEPIAERTRVDDDLTDHVVIVGFGLEGQRVADACVSADRPFVVIERDPSLIDRFGERIEGYVVGDVTDRAVREAARVAEACLIVSTVIEEGRSARLLELDPEAEVLVRARDTTTAAALLDRGALVATVPDVLAGGRLAEDVERLLEDETYHETLAERNSAEVDRLRTGTPEG